VGVDLKHTDNIKGRTKIFPLASEKNNVHKINLKLI